MKNDWCAPAVALHTHGIVFHQAKLVEPVSDRAVLLWRDADYSTVQN
ncbi:MAG: hypothetical protein AAF902_12035 [Chloroflexota bacterium]